MIKKMLFSAGTFLILSVSNNTSAQSGQVIEKINSKESKELVIGIPKITNKHLPELISIIESTSGMEYVEFCQKQRLVLVKYDDKVFNRCEGISTLLKSKGFNLPIQIKKASFKDVAIMCK